MLFHPLFVLCLALVAQLGSAKFYDERFSVVEVTAANFEQAVNKPNNLVIAHFFGPRNSNARKYKGELTKLASRLYGYFDVVALDVTQDGAAELVSQYGASDDGEPVIKVFNGATVHDYDGDMMAKSIEAFTKGLVKSATKKLSMKKHKKLIKDSSMPKALFFEDPQDDKSKDLIAYMSQKYTGRMTFHVIDKKGKKLMREYGVSATDTPRLIVLPSYNKDEVFGDAPQRAYNLKFKADQLSPFLNLHAKPVEGQDSEAMPIKQLADASCMEHLCVNRGGLCAIAVLPSHDKAMLRYNLDLFSGAERQRQGASTGSFHFLWVDSSEQAPFLEKAFGIWPADYPQLVVFSPLKKRMVSFVGSFTQSDIVIFLRQVAHGSLKTIPLLSGDDLPKLEDQETSPLCEPVAETSKPRQKQKAEEQPQVVQRPRQKKGEEEPIDLTARSKLILESQAHWIVSFQEGDDVAALQEGATSLKGMVGFGIVDVTTASPDSIPSELASLFEGELPKIVAFQEGPDKATAFKILGEGESIIETAQAMVKSGDKHVRKLESLQELSGSWVSPMQPKLLLCSNKKKPPIVLSALVSEFRGLVAIGWAAANKEVCQQFTQGSGKASLLLIIAEPSPQQEGEVMMRGNMISMKQANFAELSQILSQFRQQFPQTFSEEDPEEEEEEEITEHDEL